MAADTIAQFVREWHPAEAPADFRIIDFPQPVSDDSIGVNDWIKMKQRCIEDVMNMVDFRYPRSNPSKQKNTISGIANRITVEITQQNKKKTQNAGVVQSDYIA